MVMPFARTSASIHGSMIMPFLCKSDVGAPLATAANDAVDRIDRQRQPDQTEADQALRAQRLAVDHHAQEELEGRRDILQNAQRDQRDAAGAGREEQQRHDRHGAGADEQKRRPSAGVYESSAAARLA